MKTYNKPEISYSNVLADPYAIDIYSGEGDSTQLGKDVNFDENATNGNEDKTVWDEE